MITRQKLWRARYEDVLRLARWLRKRGDIPQRLPSGDAIACRAVVIEAVARATGAV